jgi:hypothetical protein
MHIYGQDVIKKPGTNHYMYGQNYSILSTKIYKSNFFYKSILALIKLCINSLLYMCEGVDVMITIFCDFW